ncbi:hypothetical protein [Frankia sp. R82]|uniref:DUF6919 domain-containing protein n=1 Tax=Frankia sp. R82 TaxID=2950553 RepID=UPI002042DFC0|nr:hypothetical protein [Frankia sp. R82]MCM3884164.1 hypothetical protein [Frankia sp. R82]
MKTRSASDLGWRSATSLDDLGELTARWLLGDIPAIPGQAGRPDLETAEIRDALVTLNRGGLVTTMSQPQAAGTGWRQRAAVTGLASADVARRLETACRRAGLGVGVVSPGERHRWHRDSSRAATVGEIRGSVSVLVGAVESTHALRLLWGPHLSRSGLAVVLGACEVFAYDPEWTRSGLLWDTLTRAI